MFRRLPILAVLIVISGCGPSTKEKYDEAVRALEAAEARLDSLRPAYDAARQTAANAVCRELAGATPEESAGAALAGLGSVLNPTATPPAEEGKADGETKQASPGKKGDELDQAIDNLAAAQKEMTEKQAALAAPIAKANEVMNKIKTPGTPEAKKFEEKLAAMPEVNAYERQEKRVQRAKEEVDELEKELPGGGEKSDTKK